MKLAENPKNVTEIIVPADMCSGCGVCAGICPAHCLEMQACQGKYHPVLVKNCLERCNLCLAICPFYEHDLCLSDIADNIFGKREAIQYDQTTGYYLQAYVGHSLITDQRARGASGGMATWVLEQLLESEVDRVIAVGAITGSSSRLFQYEIYTSPEQVRKAASSKYYPVEISTVLRTVWKELEDYRYAIIGLPCTLQAIRRATLRHRRLAGRVKYLLGLVCNHCPGSYYTEFLCTLAGVSISDVQRIDYRFKGSTSAIDYQFRALVNGVWSKPVGLLGLPSRVWGKQYFAYNACGYCDDVFAEVSDAVFMDAWLPQYLPETRGTSIIVVRDKALCGLLESGLQRGLCDLTPLPIEQVKASQSPVVHHKKQTIRQRISVRRQKGEWLPKMRAQPTMESCPIELHAAQKEIRSVYLSNSLWTFFRKLPASFSPTYCRVVDWLANLGKPKKTILKEIIAKLKQQAQSRKKMLLAPDSRGMATVLFGYAHGLRWMRRIRKSDPVHSSMLVLPPSSPGSLGDQAVLTALVQQAQAKRVENIAIVSCSDNDDWSYLGAVGQPSVLNGLFQYHSWRERLNFINAVRQYDTFYVIGTDVLDGAYAESFSTSRLALADLAHATGAETSIISFSVNSQLTGGALRAFKDLSARIRLCTRDPVSNERLSGYLGRSVELSADIAFLLEPNYEAPVVQSVYKWTRVQKALDRTIVGFNACREWLTFTPQLTVHDIIKVCTDTFAGLFSECQNVSFVLVPHDIRGDVSDHVLAQKIYEAMPEHLQASSIVIPPCNARDIKAICASLDIALSGRMHFAIACLGQGVPVAGITYQDKFEGLYRHFDLQNMAISPERAFLSEGLLEFFLPLFRSRDSLRQNVAVRLPRVIDLARVNLLNLDS